MYIYAELRAKCKENWSQKHQKILFTCTTRRGIKALGILKIAEEMFCK